MSKSNIRSYFKQLYFETLLGRILIHPFKWVYELYFFNPIQDKKYLQKKYNSIFDSELNLKYPSTLNEKIQWLKLNQRSNLMTLCADKYAVRKYIKRQIGEEYLIELVFCTTNSKDITAENLPNTPFVIKTNHDSGNVFIVRDKRKVDWIYIRKQLTISLRNNYYHDSREWQYKNIKPCIIVEELLQDQDENILSDIKFCCINGRVEVIHVDSNKEVEHLRNNYSRDWQPLELAWPRDKKPGNVTDKPSNLNKLIELAETLAKPFEFVRIDFYVDDEKIYFGEITFHPTSGFGPMEPPKYDEYLGKKLII